MFSKLIGLLRRVRAAFERTDSSFRNRVAHKAKKFATCFRPFALPRFLQRLPGIEPAEIHQLERAFNFISLLPGKPGTAKSDRADTKEV